MERILYHYTSEQGYRGILESEAINPSLKANNPKDARFGEGQYVSNITPRSKRPSQLSMIFFGIPWAGKRFEYHINIDVRGLDVIYGRKNVYLIPNNLPLDISHRLTGHGKN
ncbi:HYD1 signature containing ADP-ribosyltransferase family protein [Hahella ganghwensis]|uniref:HYD1 signature containing ADP-ribosyltransferase family protein n=1 Tax=Hahella ganghwensis TaxID=286420 RepID=UPI0003603A75|nr:HYD1 signature containing ADP-ribosyltransferase family protein [Hahella ganghwensis]